MLYFWFRPQRESLDMIEALLSVMTYVVVEHVTECHDLSRPIKFLIMAWLN